MAGLASHRRSQARAERADAKLALGSALLLALALDFGVALGSERHVRQNI